MNDRPQEQVFLTREAIQHLDDLFNNGHEFTPDKLECRYCAEIGDAARTRLEALAERKT